QANVGACGRRYGPRERPSRAVEHGQRPQIAALMIELESEGVGERAQIGTAMAIDGSLRVACGARGVEQADVVPFVGNAGVGEGSIARGDETLVLDLAKVGCALRLNIGDVDDDGTLVPQPLESWRHRGMKLAVGQQHLSLAVLEAEGDERRIEANV